MSGCRRLACLALLLLCSPLRVVAADPCTLPDTYAGATTAARIAATACTEHRLWYRPFIDAQGRLAGSRVREAEAARLGNGQPAWERVVEYWRDSGLLWQTQAASACGGMEGIGAPAWCRGFVVDTPWSAAFVSWVMQQADVPGYRGSASHVHYVRRAYRDPLGSAYRVSYPQGAKPVQGDLLCYARVASRTYGFDGLMAQLAGDDGGLNMHCDIVVGIADGMAYLVGGNVFDGVTMRMLALDASARLSTLPMRSTEDPECAPERPEACDMNRQDWAVLLQLRPETELAALRAPRALPELPVAGPAQPLPARCCVECVPEDTAPPCAPMAEQGME
ncbi:DUF2272 domain-containing protein [Luteimonas aestuarii]|uniref:DUF2272 domain-containing protein n=1 Tax=Luteimonas aestuarii TaxID=453837 RepID=A0A4R5TN17_9GAMM|nr:DUF2272 domain-containing protein [Luteimonas aestuarii]